MFSDVTLKNEKETPFRWKMFTATNLYSISKLMDLDILVIIKIKNKALVHDGYIYKQACVYNR